MRINLGNELVRLGSGLGVIARIMDLVALVLIVVINTVSTIYLL